MENLIIKVNVGSQGGIFDYTIDAIKYIDGTEINDVIMDGNRTVKAGVRADDRTYVNVSNQSATLTSLYFDANFVDLYELIEKSEGYAKAILYDGVSIVKTLDLSVGNNIVTFDNLTPNTLYQYSIVALYDNLSGDGIKLNTIYTYATYTNTIVLFDDIKVTQGSVSFNYLWYTDITANTITNLELYLGGEKVKDLDKNALAVDNLLSNRNYMIKASYNNLANESETILFGFTTVAKAIPTMDIIGVDSTQNAINFDISITDIDEVGSIASIELYKGEELVESLTDLTAREFTGLLSNNLYTIKATYTYDLNDGAGAQTIVKTKEITTLSKATPIIDIADITSTQTAINFDISITDIDEVGSIASIELYKGEELVESLTDLTGREFTSLLSNNLYTVKATYTYDLNDGVGEREKIATAEVWTAPDISFTEAICANTSAVSKGEIIYFEALVNNPNNVTFNTVKINGEYYSVSAGTTYDSIIVNMTVEDQFEGGDTELILTEIIGTLNGVERRIEVSENNTASVFVNGELNVLSVKVVDNYGREPEFLVQGEQYFYYVELANRTGYQIDSITINDTIYSRYHMDFCDTETSKVMIKVSFAGGWHSFSVSSISYSNDSVGNKTKEIAGINNKYLCVTSATPTVISTADDLKNMSGWGYYVLESDIDLSAVEWSNPGNFRGYFDGQGHQIKNINYAGTVENEDFYWGLFNTANGMISNVIVSGRLLLTIEGGSAYTGGIAVSNYYNWSSNELRISSVGSNVNISVNNTARGGIVGNVTNSYWRVGNYYSAIVDGNTYSQQSLQEVIDLIQPVWDETVWDFDTLTPSAKERFTITYHLDGGENNIDNLSIYTIRSTDINLLQPTKTGYIFLGWYNNQELSGESIIKITAGTYGDLSLYASWELCDSHTLDENCICTKCGTVAHTEGEDGYCSECNTLINIPKALEVYGYAREGTQWIYFGEYPQTIKADDVTVGTTADSRGYYLGSDDYYYAKVTATPYGSDYKFSTDATVTSGTVYYFKVEPIKWRILSESNGQALILCESIIANKRFDNDGSNNYMNSEIRTWLNNEFYNTAFTSLQQALILTTEVDNSAYSTGYDPNQYACANTNDKIFLPSYRDIINTSYGFSSSTSSSETRERLTSDCSRATGAYMNTNASYYGNGWWWLRSPYYGYSDGARYIGSDGNIDYFNFVDSTRYGVVPALKIQLS